jgi:hypothetical protein
MGTSRTLCPPGARDKPPRGESYSPSNIERLKAAVKGGFLRLRPTGTASRILNAGDDWCCLRSTLRGLYAYETNHPPDSYLPIQQGVNSIMQPYYRSELVAVLLQEVEKLCRRSLLPLSTERSRARPTSYRADDEEPQSPPRSAIIASNL